MSSNGKFEFFQKLCQKLTSLKLDIFAKKKKSGIETISGHYEKDYQVINANDKKKMNNNSKSRNVAATD